MTERGPAGLSDGPPRHEAPRRPATRALLVALGAAPYLLVLARPWLPAAFASGIDGLFAPACERAPERTLALAGALMPVCSRCAGFHAGLALAAIVARPRMREAASRRVLLAAAAVAALDVLAQDAGLHPIWHPVRLATGAALGWAVTIALLSRER